MECRNLIINKVQDAYFLADPQELLKLYLKYVDYVTIEKREVSSEELISDQSVNNAKIDELESLVREMKKKLDKVNKSIINFKISNCHPKEYTLFNQSFVKN